MSGDEWRQGVVWGGRTPPSGVVAGFRRDVACNVSETKSRIAPCNVVLTQNAKSRLRSFGGLKPALRPPSGINAGFVKRRQCWVRQAGIFPFPRLRGKVPEGRKGDKVAKRRKCWARQAAWLLGFVETLPATSQKRKTVLRRAMLFLPKMQKAGCARSAG